MERFRNLAEVWRQLRTLDPKAAGWIILAAAGGLALGGGVGFLLSLWAIVPMALLTGVLVALIVFNIRARRAMYGAIEGQLGAAAAVLQQMRGAWFVSP
jgi:Flp pilus assembly protein TadB